MKSQRSIGSPLMMFLALGVAYAILRFGLELPDGVPALIALSSLSAGELVATVWLLLQPRRRGRAIVAHGLNAVGTFLMAYGILSDRNLVSSAVGTGLFVVGMLLWVVDLKTARVGVQA